MPLDDLRAFYRTGEEIELGRLPAGSSRVVARRADGRAIEAKLDHGDGPLAGMVPGTYAVEALAADGRSLAEELTTVGAHAGERPVHGFATSFDDESVPAVLEWLRALRCTVVQIYDWMATYTEPLRIGPLGPAGGWHDPSGRPVSFEALRSLASGIRAQGAVAHAYAPVYAVDLPFAADHPEMLMYRNDGAPQSFFDFIQLADPSNVDWQRHFAAAYGRAADSVGFDGFHIDTYGYPREATNRQGQSIDMRAAYRSFLSYFRSERPDDLVSFNQVNGVPSALELAPGPAFVTARCGLPTAAGATWRVSWTAAPEWRGTLAREQRRTTSFAGPSPATRRSGAAGTAQAPSVRSLLLRPSPRAWERVPSFSATGRRRCATLTTPSTRGSPTRRRPLSSPGTGSHCAAETSSSMGKTPPGTRWKTKTGRSPSSGTARSGRNRWAGRFSPESAVRRAA